MSSTNRGSVRNKDDFYVTPDWATDVILPHLARPSSVLEPAAGAGGMKRRVELFWPGAAVHSIELDPVRAQTSGSFCANYLTAGHLRPFDLVITNPPFSLAIEFATRAIEAMPRDGEVALLLRLSFLESADRRAFHIKHPADVHVFTRRPSFGVNRKGKKGSDSAAYAWFVWGPRRGNRWVVLDCPTAPEVKRLSRLAPRPRPILESATQ